MNNLGEFIDHIEKTNSDASIWIGAIIHRSGVTDEHRREYRERSFNKANVVDFALAVADEGREMIASGSSGEYIKMIFDEVHALLRCIHGEATKHSILCGIEEIDVSLSPSEAIIRAYRSHPSPA